MDTVVKVRIARYDLLSMPCLDLCAAQWQREMQPFDSTPCLVIDEADYSLTS